MNLSDIAGVYEEYREPIRKYALRLCRDEHRANDITSETFTRLMEMVMIGKGPRTNIRSYLYQTAYHLIVDGSRKDRPLAPLEVAMNIGGDPNLVELDVEMRELLPQAISIMKFDLSQNHRHVIFLRFFDDRSIGETARVLRIKPNLVKTSQHRAINRLRKSLGEIPQLKSAPKEQPMQTTPVLPIEEVAIPSAPDPRDDIYVESAPTRRTPTEGYIDRITLGDLSLNASYVIEWKDKRISLTQSQFKIFRKLLLYGRANHKELYRALYNVSPPSWNDAAEIIRPVICHLRRKVPRGLIKSDKRGSREYVLCREALT